MTLLPSLHKARDKAGANTAKGRHYNAASQILLTQPVDDDQARRQTRTMRRIRDGLRALIAAERGGATHG